MSELVMDPAVGLRATESLPAERFATVRREMVLRHCKWDPQVGDVRTLADFALVMRRAEWLRLASVAEVMARETVLAEAELLERPELWRELGVPRRLRGVLAAARARPVVAGRVMRFDFHPGENGWWVSEVNSDVPGGYVEASAFARLMGEALELETAGDAGGAVAKMIGERAVAGVVGLLCAPGYMEDRQVVAYLAGRVRACGCAAEQVGLQDLRWRDGRARLADGREVSVLVRFYQAEWLAELRWWHRWREALVGGETVVVNPASAALTENKAFPLVWDRLRTPMAMWRRMLPETRAPAEAPWREGGWLLKERYSNNGDSVVAIGEGDPRVWRRVEREVRRRPGAWVAQRRVAGVTIDTPAGALHPCIGVYVVAGRAAGMYGRLSRGWRVDYAATDVAVLLEEDNDGG
jgi:glutathionylspermidine synthase